jgi:hypothetical protein
MSKGTTQVRDILFDRQTITGIIKDINPPNRVISLTSDLCFSVSGDRDFRYHPEASKNFLNHFLILTSSFILSRNRTVL